MDPQPPHEPQPIPPIQPTADPMPTAPLPSHSPEPSRNNGLMLIAVAAVLLILVAIVTFFLWPRPQPTSSPAEEQASAADLEAVERTQKNTDRTHDATNISASIAEFMANNLASLPTRATATDQELTLCGTVCDSSSVALTLVHFQASNATFKDFSAALTVPDADTVYLVAKGQCKTDGMGISSVPSPSNREMAVLYGLDAGSGKIEQHCQGL